MNKRILAPVLLLTIWLSTAQGANAAWLGFRNDTKVSLSISLCTNGRTGSPITLAPGETSWNFVADDSTSTVTVSNTKKAVLVRFETVAVTKKEDVLYAIEAAAKETATATRVAGAKKGR